jgi:FOG: EAL domain
MKELSESFEDRRIVTLSMGVTFSDEGYSDKLFNLADGALYETKGCGGSGCTMVGPDGQIINHCQNGSKESNAEGLFIRNTTAVGRFEFPSESDKPPVLICNDYSKRILGFDVNYNPEQCYELWAKGLDLNSKEMLGTATKKMLEGRKIECTVPWRHPHLGNIHIRIIATGEVKNGRKCFYSFFQPLKDIEIVEKAELSKKIANALGSIYFASNYFDINSGEVFFLTGTDFSLNLMKTASNTKEAFSRFLSGMVSDQDLAAMTEFCDMTTLKARIKGQTHIDQPYLSKSVGGWCMATFIVVDKDENGDLKTGLFVISRLDHNRAQEIKKSKASKEELNLLYDSVPGGIVLYRWDGKNLSTLHISKFYRRLYGYTLNDNGSPDFKRVHPDDVENYKKAIHEAITVTHRLEYVYRVYNPEKKRYVWTKIDAISKEMPDGTFLVFCIYTNIDSQKEAEAQLDRERASLVAALNASSQYCWEYDPETNSADSLTGRNIFGLPLHVENYLEVIERNKIIHPDDLRSFIKTADSLKLGLNKARCDARILIKDHYIWHSCTFNAYFDPGKERKVAILTIVDISSRVAALQSFEHSMQAMIAKHEDAIGIGSFNLTGNTVSELVLKGALENRFEGITTYDQLHARVTAAIMVDAQKTRFENRFSRKGLLKAFSDGEMYTKIELLMKFKNGGHVEWVEVICDLAKNPISTDIEGICSIKSINSDKLSALMLQAALQEDYYMAALIPADTDEYYIYAPLKNLYCETRYDFWCDLDETLRTIASPEDLKDLRKNVTSEKVNAKIDSDGEASYHFSGRIKDKAVRLELRFLRLQNERITLVAVRNITDRSMIDKLKQTAEHDPVTGLYNRTNTFRKCRKLLTEHPKEKYAIIHLDIRHFHLYNTFFGDEAGNELLCRLADAFRDADYHTHWVFGRIDADVFLFLVPVTSKALIEEHITMLKNGLKEYRADFLLEPACGVYFIEDISMSIEQMFSRATIAAKSNRTVSSSPIIYFNKEMEKKLTAEQFVINEMRTALDTDQFKIYLQPKYSLRTNKPVGAEVLVRWFHPEKGMVSPGAFIPVFERNGFILDLDRHMWEKSCALIKEWQDNGMTILPISVNISRVSMYSPGTVPFLKALVTRYGISPSYLDLELTETAYMDDPEEIRRQLADLQNFGFKIHIDDFGSGYSSLNTLKDVPVDCLKLDMKFLSETESSYRNRMLLFSVVRMAKLLGLTVIAEGVETQAQAEYLKHIGCEYVQGFFFAKPMPVKDYEVLVKTSYKGSRFESKKRKQQPTPFETPSPYTVLGTLVPSPMAVFECGEGGMSYLWANNQFFTEFNLENRRIPDSSVFSSMMGKTEYARLEKAFLSLNENNPSLAITFSIRAMDGERKYHLQLGLQRHARHRTRGKRSIHKALRDLQSLNSWQFSIYSSTHL